MKKLAIVIVLLILVGSMVGWAVSVYNQEIPVRARFQDEERNRIALFENVRNTLKSKGVVAKTNDSSFQNMVKTMMANRADGPNVGMKWIHEQYPNLEAGGVAAMYKDLSRTIEEYNERFFQQERMLSSIKQQDDMLLRKFPGNLMHKMLGTQEIAFKPIQSTAGKNVFETGINDGATTPF